MDVRVTVSSSGVYGRSTPDRPETGGRPGSGPTDPLPSTNTSEVPLSAESRDRQGSCDLGGYRVVGPLGELGSKVYKLVSPGLPTPDRSSRILEPRTETVNG